MDHFKKQFAYLEEHYGKGGTVSPLDRQHASLPRYPNLCESVWKMCLSSFDVLIYLVNGPIYLLLNRQLC